jgi:type IV pilus assembly protein PilM
VGTEIQKTLDFFKATSASDPVSLIEITGGAARTPNLVSYLSRRFDTQVEIMNPFRSIAINERAFPPDRLEPMSTAAAVAVGLALRKVGDK